MEDNMARQQDESMVRHSSVCMHISNHACACGVESLTPMSV